MTTHSPQHYITQKPNTMLKAAEYQYETLFETVKEKMSELKPVYEKIYEEFQNNYGTNPIKEVMCANIATRTNNVQNRSMAFMVETTSLLLTPLLRIQERYDMLDPEIDKQIRILQEIHTKSNINLCKYLHSTMYVSNDQIANTARKLLNLMKEMPTRSVTWYKNETM